MPCPVLTLLSSYATLCRYALSGTESAMSLRLCYALSVPISLSPYACARRCPVLTSKSAYATAGRSRRIMLRARYAVPSTGVACDATPRYRRRVLLV
eukprot:2327391-Rhodomonas_salina.1